MRFILNKAFRNDNSIIYDLFSLLSWFATVISSVFPISHHCDCLFFFVSMHFFCGKNFVIFFELVFSLVRNGAVDKLFGRFGHEFNDRCAASRRIGYVCGVSYHRFVCDTSFLFSQYDRSELWLPHQLNGVSRAKCRKQNKQRTFVHKQRARKTK